eukprot:2987112-Rhodomonas_salina.1
MVLEAGLHKLVKDQADQSQRGERPWRSTRWVTCQHAALCLTVERKGQEAGGSLGNKEGGRGREE